MRTVLISPNMITRAATDMARGESRQPVAEIVTFRLIEGSEPQAFAKAADGMTEFLENTGAVLSRTLSLSPEGTWTDYLTWTSLDAAQKASSELMALPQAAPFMNMIDPDSVSMTHAPILFSMQKE